MAAANLGSAHSSTALRLDYKANQRGVGLGVTHVRRYVFPDVNTDMLSFRVRDLTSSKGDHEETASRLLVNGKREDFGSNVFAKGPALPALEAVTGRDGREIRVRLGPEVVWKRSVVSRPRLRIESMPVVAKAGAGSIKVGYSVKGLPEVLRAFPAKPVKVAGAFSGSDEDSAHAESVLSDVDRDVANNRLDLPLRERSSSVRLHAQIASTAITPPVNIGFYRPGNRIQSSKAYGRMLFVNDARAVLLSPVKRLETMTERGDRPSASALKQGTWVVVDEFWANTTAPGGDLQPGALLESALGHGCVHLPVSGDRRGESLPDLAKFGALDEVAAADPVLVIWAVGIEDLRAGVSLENLISRLAFLAVHTLRNGALPVLVTPPPAPGLADDRMRKAAYRMKRLAFKLRIPVADMYSRVYRLRARKSGEVNVFSSSSVDGVSESLNNRGRRLLSELLKYNLRSSLGGVPFQKLPSASDR